MTNKVYPEYKDAVAETGAVRGAGDGLFAEATLYNLLKAQLPSDWGFLWGLQLGTHEYDFLVLVPGRGLVNVECKGDGYRFGSDYQFEVVGERKDLIGQARGAVSYYKTYLQRCLFCDERYEFGLLGHCVVFPIRTYEVDFRQLRLPVYDENDCTAFAYKNKTGLTAIVEKSLDDAENYLRNDKRVWKPAQLSREDAEQIWKFWMQPPQRVNLTRQYKINLESFKQQMVNYLNITQTHILNTISNPQRNNILVKGAAGTGKSVLAQAAAANLSGSKLYVCFNKVLACYTRLMLPKIPGLDISHFHKLDELLLGERIIPDNQNGNPDWNAVDQKMLDKARERTPGKRYDCIIIDEAQDLTKTQLRFLLRFRKNRGKIILFSSTEQQIYGNRLSEECLEQLLPNLEICSLDVNLRNTKQVDTYCQNFLENPQVTATLEGPEVVENITLRSDAINQFLKDEVMSSFQSCDVAVLAPERALLNAVTRAGTTPFYGPDDNLRQTEKNLENWHKGKAGWKSTTHSFKGLESMVVVHLIPENRDYTQLQYIGGSRAKYKLYIVRLQQ